MGFRKLLLIVTMAVVVAGLVLATGTMASSPEAKGDDNQVVSKDLVLASETRELTAREMRNAKPAPMPEVSGEPVFAEAAAQPSGPMEVVPGGLGEGKGLFSVDLLGDVEPLYTPKSKAYSYPPPFTRYRLLPNPQYRKYPHRTIGKVFFTGTDGRNYVCSGSVAVGKAVWTTGHCVYNNKLISGPNGWHTNVKFCPAYRAGKKPYGCWRAYNLATLNGWVNGKLQYDIGMFVVRKKDGKTIGQRVGWLGAMWNASSKKHWHDFGYPQASPFNGKFQYICTASRAWLDASWGRPYPIGIGCDMTGGCSGGPWLVKYQPHKAGAMNYVNSVNSYRYTSPSQPKAIHGPYFGNGAKNLYNWGKAQ